MIKLKNIINELLFNTINDNADYENEDEDDSRAELYFSIGQDSDDFCWIWNGNDVILKKGGTHGWNFTHEIADRNFRGWYDTSENVISVVFPKQERRKLGNRNPTEHDIPQYLYQKLINKFGKRKPRFVVFETKLNESTKLIENLSFSELMGYTDEKRVERSRNVSVRPLRVTTINDNESWTFSYKSSPSTTGRRHKGYIQFLKGNVESGDDAQELDCIADCTCEDFLYRWAYADKQKNASVNGSNSWNKSIDRPPRLTNPENKPGLCKHLISLGRYLKTKIRKPIKRNNLFEDLNNITKQKEFDITTCGNCGYNFDRNNFSESRMGFIKCPNCNKETDQEGNVFNV